MTVENSTGPKSGEPLRILLVEDELADVLLLRRAMERAGLNWSLTVARNGIRALSLITSPNYKVPDLVLLGLSLPGRSGLEVLSRLRRQPVWRDRPVLLLSAAQAQKGQAVPSGSVAGYLVKPESFSETIALLKNLDHSIRVRGTLPSIASYPQRHDQTWGRYRNESPA